MDRSSSLTVEPRPPGGADERPGGIIAAVEIQRADQTFDHIADDIVALGGEVLAGLAAEADLFGNAALAADVGASLARDERIVAAAHLALRLVGEALVEPLGDDQAEHPVTEEFEPLIGGPAGAAMGQRLLVERHVVRLVAQRGGEEGA